jgi:large subunit ribosomal protein L11
MKVKLIVEGGAMKPGPVVSQQLGPLGINLGKVVSDVNIATDGFKGMNVPVEIDVDPKTKTFSVKVFSPSVAELIKKEAGAEKGSGAPNNIKMGDIAFERVVHIAKTKMPSFLAKDLRAAIKLVVGTCVSLGVLIDNKEAKEIEKDINTGLYDREINEEITEPSAEKKKQLQEFFAVIREKQERAAKAAAEAKAAEEAAKVAAATTAPGAAAGATQAAAGTPGQTAAPAAAKKEEKKEEKKEKKK